MPKPTSRKEPVFMTKPIERNSPVLLLVSCTHHTESALCLDGEIIQVKRGDLGWWWHLWGVGCSSSYVSPRCAAYGFLQAHGCHNIVIQDFAVSNRAIARAIRTMGLTANVRRGSSEWRINYPEKRGGTEQTAYYTEDRLDALFTAQHMRNLMVIERKAWDSLASMMIDNVGPNTALRLARREGTKP
jgi:hypothetical protein